MQFTSIIQDGRSPIVLAARKDHLEVVKLLMIKYHQPEPHPADLEQAIQPVNNPTPADLEQPTSADHDQVPVIMTLSQKTLSSHPQQIMTKF